MASPVAGIYQDRYQIASHLVKSPEVGAVGGRHGRYGRGARVRRRLAPGDDEAATVRARAALDADALTREADAFLAELHALAPDAHHIIDKMPDNARHFGFIARLLPAARIIHCTRDPREIGLSIYQLRFFVYHPYAHDLADLD